MDKHGPSSTSFHTDTRDLDVVVMIERFHSTRQQRTIVREPARRLLCTDGERGQLLIRQLIFMGVPATALIHGL
jgi:hypothetical protein